MPFMPALTPLVVFQLMAFAVSIGFAFWRDAVYRRHYPDRKPYRWGYFYGTLSLLGGLSVVFEALQRLPHDTNVWLAFGFFSAAALLAILFGIAIIFRRPWAWIFSILYCFAMAARIARGSGDVFGIIIFITIALFNSGYLWQRRDQLAGFLPAAIKAKFLR